MNKIYSVLRIDNWDRAQSVYNGRIRDCKKSLKTIERKKKEDELATQNVASNSGNVVQTTTNQNI